MPGPAFIVIRICIESSDRLIATSPVIVRVWPALVTVPVRCADWASVWAVAMLRPKSAALRTWIFCSVDAPEPGACSSPQPESVTSMAAAAAAQTTRRIMMVPPVW